MQVYDFLNFFNHQDINDLHEESLGRTGGSAVAQGNMGTVLALF